MADLVKKGRPSMLAKRQAEVALILDIEQIHNKGVATAAELILGVFQKLLRLSQSPDFQNCVGPVDTKVLLKLADWVSTNLRLMTGSSTKNVAHVHTVDPQAPGVDFAKLTQAERDQWKNLAAKAAATLDGEIVEP